jgi:hypothetical protein
MIKKFVTFEQTLTKKEIEKILWEYLSDKLDKEDKDFKASRMLQADYTYRFTDGHPEIEVVIIVEDANFRK